MSTWKKWGIGLGIAFVLLLWADPGTAASLVTGAGSGVVDFLGSGKTFVTALFK